MDRFTKFFYIYATGFSKNLDALGQLLCRKLSVFHFFSLNIVNNTICLIIVCPLWTDTSIFSFVTSPPLLLKQAYMAIKALKQSVSISETQKMIHQWKAKGITDSATLKLLDLYLGLTPYMTAEGIYPMRNLYQICQSMKTTHTTTLLENIRKCCSFGLIWNENRTHLLGFYSPPVVRRTEKYPRASSRFCCRTYSSCCQSGNYSCKSSNYE